MKSALSRQAVAALLTILALAGCGPRDAQQQPAAAASASNPPPDANPAPDAKPGIRVTDAVLMLPVVSGRPGAAYFTLGNTGTAAASLAAVHVEGADRSEIHETKGGKMEPLSTVEVPAGATVKFERGGKHVMAFDLAPSVKPQSTVEITLIFAGGDKVSVPARVVTMPGMSHEMAH